MGSTRQISDPDGNGKGGVLPAERRSIGQEPASGCRTRGKGESSGSSDRGTLYIAFDEPPPLIDFSLILAPRPGAIGADTVAHGDYDNDGIDDLIIGNPHTGRRIGRVRGQCMCSMEDRMVGRM